MYTAKKGNKQNEQKTKIQSAAALKVFAKSVKKNLLPAYMGMCSITEASNNSNDIRLFLANLFILLILVVDVTEGLLAICFQYNKSYLTRLTRPN